MWITGKYVFSDFMDLYIDILHIFLIRMKINIVGSIKHNPFSLFTDNKEFIDVENWASCINSYFICSLLLTCVHQKYKLQSCNSAIQPWPFLILLWWCCGILFKLGSVWLLGSVIDSGSFFKLFPSFAFNSQSHKEFLT